MKIFRECGLYVPDIEKAQWVHLKSAGQKSHIAASKQAGALGSFIKKRPALPTPKQIAAAERANAATTVPIRKLFPFIMWLRR